MPELLSRSRRLAAASITVAIAAAPALLPTVLLSGCGVWQGVSDTTSAAWHAVFYRKVKVLNVDLAAREGLNLDDAGKANSVAVRVYQLRDRKSFDAASYDDLLKNDRTVLAQDLADSMAVVVNPGASSSLTQPMKTETNYVAIIALVRQPGTDGAWRRVISTKNLDPEKPLKLELVASRLQSPDDATATSTTTTASK
ncbi:type VI secretion system lipoprotein TssJ [Paraburkholderia sacchari]|uniref:Type VI secretion system lipoprotein TssJ n=1 Tax=Paraburkholderia sacchari TaxID=159450 RepID=A0A8T6ZL12_9BURK|nr:type VI secretion system lipoprotein TssJ [Paraburkholderia sacchari]NLP64964.1 type VI secretion system lipoprotein TssJ [Paraburkholderia sacchari]